VDPELRNRFKAVAALKGKTLREWVIEALIDELEDEIDAREGLAVLGEVEGTISLKEYLSSGRVSQRV
jgi:predicted DNA-binding protein